MTIRELQRSASKFDLRVNDNTANCEIAVYDPSSSFAQVVAYWNNTKNRQWTMRAVSEYIRAATGR